MSGRRILFIDRDGTLNEETDDEKVDRLDKVRFLPRVIPALLELKRAGFILAMVTNQDGLGTPDLPTADFEQAHRFILHALESQGVTFDEIFICPHFLHEGCACRKPKLGLVRGFVDSAPMDTEHSYMIGDRDTCASAAAPPRPGRPLRSAS